MIDRTVQYRDCGVLERRSQARAMLNSNPNICHIVVGYSDEGHADMEANPVFLIFDDVNEWDSWVAIYQPKRLIDALHQV